MLTTKYNTTYPILYTTETFQSHTYNRLIITAEKISVAVDKKMPAHHKLHLSAFGFGTPYFNCFVKRTRLFPSNLVLP